MRVMVMVKATKEAEAGALPTHQQFEDMERYNEALVKAGVILAAEGLQASSRGKRIRYEGKRRTVIDGPFLESKELIAGYSIWQVKSMDEAIEWARRAPFSGGEEVELRPLMDGEDHLAREEEARRRAEAGRP